MKQPEVGSGTVQLAGINYLFSSCKRQLTPTLQGSAPFRKREIGFNSVWISYGLHGDHN